MQPNEEIEAGEMGARQPQADEAVGSKEPKPRGFAAMAPEMHKEIASRGGKAAHRLGVAYTWTKETARAAGRKGGTKVASIPGRMAELGRLGAKARAEALPSDEAEE